MGEAAGDCRVSDLAFGDRAVFVCEADTLVLADLHLGRSSTSAVDAPLGEHSDISQRLEGLLDRFEPDEVVIAGDVLHAFDTVPPHVEDGLFEIRQTIEEEADATAVFVAGNHDAVLETIVEPVPEYHLRDGNTVVCHGHELPETAAARYIIGHDHPAIRIEGTRHPCFLVGSVEQIESDVIALPAFNPIAMGMLVNTLNDDDFASPLLHGIGGFRPLVRDETADETLQFPPLNQLRDHL